MAAAQKAAERERKAEADTTTVSSLRIRIQLAYTGGRARVFTRAAIS